MRPGSYGVAATISLVTIFDEALKLTEAAAINGHKEVASRSHVGLLRKESESDYISIPVKVWNVQLPADLYDELAVDTASHEGVLQEINPISDLSLLRSAEASLWNKEEREYNRQHAASTPHASVPPAWHQQSADLNDHGGWQNLAADLDDEGPGLSPEQEVEAKSRLTRWQCLPAHGSQYWPEVKGNRTTCKFNNLYYEVVDGHGGFVVHTLKGQGDRNALHGMTLGASSEQGEFHEAIHVEEHGSLEEFYRRSASWTQTVEYKGLTVAFHPVWHFNVGHALFDGLYPAFVSLMQHGDEERQFRPFVLAYREAAAEKELPGNYRHVEDIFSQIGLLSTIQRNDLNSGNATRHRFDEVVMGVGTNSAKLDTNVNYTLGACRSLDACRTFRKRVFSALGLGVPTSARRTGPFRVKVVLNKRDHDQFKELFRSLQEQSSSSLKDFIFDLVDWSPDKKRSPDQTQEGFDSTQNGDFKRHMEVIRETDVHISGPGTAQMYQTFLPDGAVHINMGSSFHKPFGFMEEYMAEGASYFWALYYPWRAEHEPLFSMEIMASLLNQARGLLERGLKEPVPVNHNLSPLGKVYKAYAYWLHQDKMNLHDLARLMPLQRELKSHDWFGNNFVEDFVYPGRKCSFDCEGRNTSILKELMLSYDMHRGQRRGHGWFTRYLSQAFAEGKMSVEEFKTPDVITGNIVRPDVAKLMAVSGIV